MNNRGRSLVLILVTIAVPLSSWGQNSSATSYGAFFDRILTIAGAENKSSVLGLVRIRGVNSSTAGTPETVWNGPTDIRPTPSTPLTMIARSTSTDDDVGQSGLESIRVICINVDGDEFFEDLDMDGTNPSDPMNQACLRVQSAIGIDFGSTLSSPTRTNVGDITIEDQATGDVYEFVPAGTGESRSFVYTVPRGTVAVAGIIFISVGDDSVAANIKSRAPGFALQSETIEIANGDHEFTSDACGPAGTDFGATANNLQGGAGVSLTINAGLWLVVKPDGRCPGIREFGLLGAP